MKLLLKFLSVLVMFCNLQLFGAYTDEFGPLQSYYTMGDFVRYTVTLGLNHFYKAADIPYAQDIYNYRHNTDNLYNAVGYLYSSIGYVYDSYDYQGPGPINWEMRKPGNGALDFDNNIQGKYTLFFSGWNAPEANAYQLVVPGTPSSGVIKPANPADADSALILQNLSIKDGVSAKGKACAYDPFVMVYDPNGSITGLNVVPYGQFFGARIAHILGVVTNDVPAKIGSSGPTIATKTAMPQLALMKGGYTVENAPVGSVTISTAHFGTMENFLTDATNSYLQSHLLPTVKRLANLFYYDLDLNDGSTENFIRIKSDPKSITAYDNGIIAQIENNTGDALQVNQYSFDSFTNIGTLATGQNNYFLHTASLMSDGGPSSDQMIEIKDTKAQYKILDSSGNQVSVTPSIFIQVVTSAQLQAIIASVNAQIQQDVPGTTSASVFAYNQQAQIAYSAPTDGAYVLLTNFNPKAMSTDTNTLLMYRMQAINVVEFSLKPYFITLQINKENIAYGIAPDSSTNVEIVNLGELKTSILYPSIASVKVFTWQNPYNKAVGTYSQMPLLLIPQVITQANIAGLQAHYGIWLTSYVAALTEFSFGGTFGDNFGYLDKIFNIFSMSSNPFPSNRVVMDSSGLLQSGQSLTLTQPAITLMGSDVWDYGYLAAGGGYYNYHQDIPALSLYQNKTTNAVEANQTNGTNVNFAVTFGSANLSSDPFGSKYGRPFENMMLFSLPTQNMQDGVVGELSQISAGNYQLIFTDQIGNVLVVGKVFDVTNSPITVQFLNTNNNPAWNSSVQIPVDVASVAVGDTTEFLLKATTSASKNSLRIFKYIPPVALSAIKGNSYDDVVKALQTTVNQSVLYDFKLENQNTMPDAVVFQIKSCADLELSNTKPTQWNLLSSMLQKGSWKTGVDLMLLGIDKQKRVIPSFGQSKPASFYLMAFDTKTGKNLGEMKISLSDFTSFIANGTVTTDSAWSDFITIDFTHGTSFYQELPEVKYPFVLTILQAPFVESEIHSPLTQLWFSPVAQDSKLFDEIPLNSEMIGAINKSLMQGNTVYVTFTTQSFIPHRITAVTENGKSLGVSQTIHVRDIAKTQLATLAYMNVSIFDKKFSKGHILSCSIQGNQNTVTVILEPTQEVVKAAKKAAALEEVGQEAEGAAAQQATEFETLDQEATEIAAQAAAKKAAEKAAAANAAAKKAREKISDKSFAIKDVASQDYKTLSAKFKTRAQSLHQIQAYDTNLIDGQLPQIQGFGGGAPTVLKTPVSFDFSIGTRLGFMFFKNLWTKQTTEIIDMGMGGPIKEPISTPLTALAPDITTILGKGTWAHGISMVLLGIDEFGRVILDMTKLDPVSFHLIVYDAKTGKNLGDVAIPMSDATRNAAGFADTNPWSNAITVGGFPTITPATAQYPVVLTISNQQPASMVKKAAVNKVAPQTQAQINAKSAAKKAAQKISEKSFALSEIASKNYKTLYQWLKFSDKNLVLHEIQISDTSLADMFIFPTSLTFNIGKRANFMLFGSSSLPFIVNDVVHNGSWQTGVSFVVLGIDEFGRIILDMTQLDPASFHLFVYDTKTGKYLGDFAIQVSDLTINAANPWVNSITMSGYQGNEFDSNGKVAMNPKNATANYPVVLTIASKPQISIEPVEKIALADLPAFEKTAVKIVEQAKAKDKKTKVDAKAKDTKTTDVIPAQVTAKKQTAIVPEQKVSKTQTVPQKQADVVVATPATYSSLQKIATYSDLAKQITLSAEHVVQYPAITSQTPPWSIVLALDYIGYIFFKDVSNTAKFVVEFAPALNAKLNWADGVRFVLLGFDIDSKLITDPTFTKQAPQYFAVFLYDGVTGAFIGSQPLQVSQTYATPIQGMVCFVDTAKAAGLYPSSFMIKPLVTTA